MSNGKGQPANVKEFIQELRGNRKTQGMAVIFLLVLAWTIWMIWPEQKKARPRPGAGPASTTSAPAVLGDQQAKLEKLPDLAKAAGAGELPKTAEMARDLFLFDLPTRAPKVVMIEVPPPPPPSEEEKAAAAERAARDQESSTRPSGVRYIGFLTSQRQGMLGAFMKGEEPLTLPIGDLSFRGWKLVKLDETGAEFQNLRFPDIRHKVQPSDGPGPGGMGPVRNDF
jgi:hypothetical protein